MEENSFLQPPERGEALFCLTQDTQKSHVLLVTSNKRKSRMSKFLSNIDNVGNVSPENKIEVEKSLTMLDPKVKNTIDHSQSHDKSVITPKKTETKSSYITNSFVKLKQAFINNRLTKYLKKAKIHRSQEEVRFLTIIAYIRRYRQKITSQSESFRFRNLNAFHKYIIGDLASDALLSDERGFGKRLSKVIKENEETPKKKSIFDLQGFLLESPESYIEKNMERIHVKSSLESGLMRGIKFCHKNIQCLLNTLNFLQKRISNCFKVLPLQSPIKIVYDVLSFFLIFFVLLFLPLQNIFWTDQGENYFLLIITIFLCFEILLSFNVAVEQDGIVYYERLKILKHSLNIHKLLDFFFILMILDLLSENNKNDALRDSHHLIMTILMNGLIIYKTIRMWEISVYFEEILLNIKGKLSLTMRIVKLFVFNLICAHIIACSWISLCFYEKSETRLENWSSEFDIERDSWFKIYIYGLYWAISTMLTVGYGDVTASSDQEAFFSIIAIMISCCLFGYTMNTIGVIVRDYNNFDKKLKKQQRRLNFFFREKGVDPMLQIRIKKYLVDVWAAKKRKILSTEDLLRLNKVILNLFGGTFLKSLCLVCREKTYLPGEVIYEEKKLDDCSYYFLSSGLVQFFVRSESQLFMLDILNENNWFGSYSFFTDRERENSAKSAQYSSLIKLEKSPFFNLIQSSQKSKEIFCFIRDKVLLYQVFKDISLFCRSCGLSAHLTQNCKLIRFCPDAHFHFLKSSFDTKNPSRSYFNRVGRESLNALRHSKRIKQAVEGIMKKHSTQINDMAKSFKQLQRVISLQNSSDSDEEEENEDSMTGTKLRKEGFDESAGNLEPVTSFAMPIDKIHKYKIYFPHNNFSMVVANLEKGRKGGLFIRELDF